MARTLAAVAREVEGELVGPDASFVDVCTDTRTLTRGSLFVALRGENFDGNDYLPAATSGGAAGALVSRIGRVEMSQIAVDDTQLAFGRMARAWRKNFSLSVVAVTGTAGKTTVKSLLAGILGVRLNTCVTEGNFNNEIGVPITLMRLKDAHEALVIELGANHAKEIDYLSSLALPRVGVITNAGAGHLEGFGSVEGVARAKGELLDHLPPGGTAVLNRDDVFFDEWRARSRAGEVVSFGFAEGADCTVVGEPSLGAHGSTFTMRLGDGETIDVELPLLGRHNVGNALAAAAAARALGVGAEEIVLGLGSVAPVRGRLLAVVGRNNARIIDDSYNANPSSVRAALDYLSVQSGRRLLVLGNMAELGALSQQLHSEVGEYARGKCDVLVGIGDSAAAAVAAFGDAGVSCPDIDTAMAEIDALLNSNLTVIIKGSRVMGLEKLAKHLIDVQPAGRRGGAGC